MFRGERPQKGRLRQFHQIGAEAIGGSDPYIDAEMIFTLDVLLRNLHLGGFTILLNSLGCDADRDSYKKKLSAYLSEKSEGLCDDCKRRSATNVLRVLDCKREGCREVVKSAPAILDNLCEGCSRDYETLKRILTHMGVAFKEKKDLVRGLDYYTKTIFEVVHTGLGSQDAIAAGGRYDGLTKQMGGADAGAMGYALGVERLLLLLDREKADKGPKGILVVSADESSREEAFNVTNRLRMSGVACETDLTGRSMKGQMRKANREARKYVVIIGEEERKTGKLVLKDMEKGEQQLLSFEELAAYLKK
jgi:histidyl-tRNA synthetase